jgi:cytochrome c biogenesis protein CcmG, thiol:disulfide interchange protein DsbE
MGQEAAPTKVSSAAKKTILLVILVAAVLPALVYLFLQAGSRESKVIGVGDRAPEFSLKGLDGNQVRLSDLRGKIVMVHFWATWCPPCVEELPTLDTISRALPARDFQVLAVSVDEGGAPAVGSFLQRNRLVLPVLLDPDHAVSSRYGTFKFPETYLVGRDGIVKYKIIGPRDWNDPAALQALQQLAAQ